MQTMLSSGAPPTSSAPFDINKFEDLLDRLEVSKRQQKTNIKAAEQEARYEPKSPALY